MGHEALPDPGVGSLVGREEELEAIGALLEAVRSGAGGMLLVEGPAGIGKTSLLREAQRMAGGSGMTVLRGLGTEFEREYAYGVVRQALAPLVRSPRDRERLLTGAARLAEPALLDAAVTVDPTPFGVLNGLYWLIAAVADDTPVLLVVDDAHWVDDPSLQFLGFLARRLDANGIGLVAAARTQAGFSAAPAALADVRAHARAHGTLVEPRALDAAGVAEVVVAREGTPADGACVAACRHATGGNPFLLDELLRALRHAGLTASDADPKRITELSVPGAIRSVGATLGRLGADATAVARAVAILGEGTTVELAGELAGLDAASTGAAADELERELILEQAEGLRFRHPILGSAVRDGLSGHERTSAHEHATELLRRRRAPAERLALQLLHVRAAGEVRVVEELREAARQARERGAPATAAALLRRALAEPPPDQDRSALLLELGRCNLDEGRLREAEASFADAHRSTDDPVVRGQAAALMAMAIPGDPESRRHVVELVRATRGAVAPLDRELGLRLQSVLVLEGDPVDDRELPGATVAEAVVLGTLVFPRMGPDARAAEIADIALRAARQADALLEEGAIALAFTGVVLGLRWTDRLDEAERLLTRAVDVARRRGSTTDFGVAMTLRANVHRRAGRLREAEADALSALPTAVDDRWLFARGIQPLVGALLDQGRVEDAHARYTEVLGEDDLIPESPPMIPVLLMRMALRAARREHDRAIADWRDALGWVQRLGRGVNAGWIEDLAVAAEAHHACGDVGSARRIAGQARDIAECWDTPGAVGQAKHVQARVGGVEDPIGALESAVSLLAESQLRLEHARALVTLGGFLRRDGRRAASREPLREGYELSVDCGAEALAEAARVELRASGVRVRRRPRGGVDELTPSEQRIAAMAADELSNAEIAQELFLTVKTVEMHLTQAYRKLEVRGRRGLAKALAQQV